MCFVQRTNKVRACATVRCMLPHGCGARQLRLGRLDCMPSTHSCPAACPQTVAMAQNEPFLEDNRDLNELVAAVEIAHARPAGDADVVDGAAALVRAAHSAADGPRPRRSGRARQERERPLSPSPPGAQRPARRLTDAQRMRNNRPSATTPQELLNLERTSMSLCHQKKIEWMKHLIDHGNTPAQNEALHPWQRRVRARMKEVVISARNSVVVAVQAELAHNPAATNERQVEVARSTFASHRRAYADLTMASGKSLGMTVGAVTYNHAWQMLRPSVAPACVVEAMQSKPRIVFMVPSVGAKAELFKEGLHEIYALNDPHAAKRAGMPPLSQCALAQLIGFQGPWITEAARHIYVIDGGAPFDPVRWADAWFVFVTQSKMSNLIQEEKVGRQSVCHFFCDEAHHGNAPSGEEVQLTDRAWSRIQDYFCTAHFSFFTGTPREWMQELPLLGSCHYGELLEGNKLAQLNICVMNTSGMAWMQGEAAIESIDALSSADKDWIRRHPKWQKLYLSTLIAAMLADRGKTGNPMQANVWAPSALAGNAQEPEARRVYEAAQSLLREGVPGLFPANPTCPVTGAPIVIDYVCSADHHGGAAGRQIAKFKAFTIDILIGDQMTRTGIDNPLAKWQLDFHEHTGPDTVLIAQSINRSTRLLTEGNVYIRRDAQQRGYARRAARSGATATEPDLSPPCIPPSVV